MKMKKAKSILRNCISKLNECKDSFTTKPLKDFSGNGKLPFEQMVEFILCMGAGSLLNEMLNHFGFSEDIATTSAFVQKRAKILPEAFESLFDMFTQTISESKSETYRGFRLLAVDGSDFLTAANPDDPDSYFSGTEDQKPYNLLHLNALYDIIQHIYVDAQLQKRRCADECGTLVNMADRSQLNDVLLLADRGYESYNVLAHIQEKGWKYLFRIKNGKGGIVSGLDLPDNPVFDVSFTLNLTNKQSKEVKQLLTDKNHFKFIPNSSFQISLRLVLKP